MKEKYNMFLELIKSEDFDSINDLLVEVSKKESKKDLVYVDYLIEEANNSLLERVKLNLIYFLGEIGKSNVLENKYLDYLTKFYFDSDRWVRNEIIQSLEKIVNNHEISSEMFDILNYAILEEYIPIKINALKLLKRSKHIPNNILKNLLKGINISNIEVVEYSIQLLKDHVKNDIALFNILNSAQTYSSLTKSSFRTLLIEYFDSMINLDTFKAKILATDWDENHKRLFIKEIESYQRILLNKIKA